MILTQIYEWFAKKVHISRSPISLLQNIHILLECSSSVLEERKYSPHRSLSPLDFFGVKKHLKSHMTRLHCYLERQNLPEHSQYIFHQKLIRFDG